MWSMLCRGNGGFGTNQEIFLSSSSVRGQEHFEESLEKVFNYVKKMADHGIWGIPVRLVNNLGWMSK